MKKVRAISGKKLMKIRRDRNVLSINRRGFLTPYFRRQMMIKKSLILSILIVLFYTTATLGSADKDAYKNAYVIGNEAARYAMKKLQKPQVGKILVITNAGFIRIDGIESPPALDAVSKITGASIGSGSLITLHSAPQRPLFFFFYNPNKEDSLYLEFSSIRRDAKKLKPSIERYESNFLGLIKQTETFDKIAKEKLMGGNEFRLLMITSLWVKGIPMEMRNSISFHDHFCPGVTSGFYIVEFVKNDFPLAKDESYYVIASPQWCKDDAIQTILNTTVGKRSLAAIPLNDADKRCLSEQAKNVAGIYFKHNRANKTSTGVVLAFDWDKIRTDAGIKSSQQKSPPSETVNLAGFMFENLKNYKKYVSAIKEFSLKDGEMPEDYARVGVNPWKRLGLWNEECEGTK